MKEININIEGYNVNGICVGCLNYNRKMYYDVDVKEMLKRISDIEIPEELSVQLCWECLAAIKRVKRFQKQILRSYEVLINYSRKHTFLDSPEDISKHAYTTICTSNTAVYNCTERSEDVITEVKEEEPMKYHVEFKEPLKDEPGFVNTEDTFLDDLPSQDGEGDHSSDEDVQLSKLRKKKKKKGVKLKKNIKHTFLDSQEDTSKHVYTTICSSNTAVYDCTEKSEDVITQAKEKEPMKCHMEFGESLKDEPGFVNTEDTFFDDLPSQDGEGDQSSDEDVQLSKFRKKKKQKGVKLKKKFKKEDPKLSRKLKNLPTNIVQLYTMSEEEMWTIRSQDVNSPDFQNMRHTCTDCIIMFNTEKLKEKHMQGKHDPKGNKHQCDVCKAYFLTKENLTVHRSLHLSAFRCTICGLITTVKEMVRKHACAKREEVHKCDDCDRAFSSKSKLAYHKNVCHQEKPQCDCCGKVFANKVTLKYHLKISPNNKDEKDKEKLHIPCKGCNKVFHSRKSYRSHVVIHDGLSYPCLICGKLFQWKRNLSRHIRAHKERETGTLHECRECRKTFASRDCYNNHMKLSKRHAEPDAYVHECNYCGKKFATKWCMVDHIDWDHLKRVKYQCTVCFKAFKTAKIMVAHINNIHEGKNREAEGEHLCEICGKSYKTEKRLKGHVWAMHTQRSNTKSYKCKLCAATFLWQTSIYKHVRMMHDNTRAKPGRAPVVKKQELYPETDMTSRTYVHNPCPPAPMILPHPVPNPY